MNFLIKKFNELTIEELYAILRARCEVFVVEQNCAFQDLDNSDQDSYHVYSMENGNITSYLRILKKGASYNETSIGRVLVSKDSRGKGIARDILLKSIDFIKDELGEHKIRISAQEYLTEFYKSLGFEIASEMYLEDEIPHIEMFKS